VARRPADEGGRQAIRRDRAAPHRGRDPPPGRRAAGRHRGARPPQRGKGLTTRPVRVGCSGWSYPDWRGRLYPEKLPQSRWLSHYAEQFGTVEVNNTFYRLATPAAVKGWVEQTPDDFTFAVKASRYLTHVKRLKGIGPYVKRFYDPLEALVKSGKLGAVLWQLPGHFKRDDERLEGALNALPPGRHAFELRHPSWFVPEVYSLLRGHDAALVIGDHPKWPFQTRERTTDWTYIRFHHGRRGRKGNYSYPELETWARRLGQWRRSTEIYGYFNNDWSGYAPENALKLKRSLGV
jgi:uncharacterized protein YecE (DUF72 family)